MRSRISLSLLLAAIGLGLYIQTHDLRWIYAGLSAAAVPFLVFLIWQERIPIRQLLKGRKN
jgi:hypothetical protein